MHHLKKEGVLKAPRKKSFWQKLGGVLAAPFKWVAKGVAKVGGWIAKGVGAAVNFVVDKAGDVVGGAIKGIGKLTGIKALEKAGDAVNNFTDNQLGPALSRTLQAPIKAVSGLPNAVMEQGLIDGIVHQGAEFVQDGIGSTARLIGGEKAEQKFDKVYDEKIQKWIEMAAGTVGRVGLALVPGGQAVLAIDAASEIGSLAYRASEGQKLGWGDYLGAGLSVASVVPGAALANAAKGAASGTMSAVSRVAPTAVTNSMRSAGSAISSGFNTMKSAATTGLTNVGSRFGLTATQGSIEAAKTLTKEGTEAVATHGTRAVATEGAKATTGVGLSQAGTEFLKGDALRNAFIQQSATGLVTDTGMTLGMEAIMKRQGQNGQYDSNIGHAVPGNLSQYGASAPISDPSHHLGAVPTYTGGWGGGT